ncbi:MAG: hypothetical protein AABZ60_00615 [Planctomycetota bacterium]
MQRAIQSAFKEFELLFQRRLRIAEKFETLDEISLLLEVWDLAQQLSVQRDPTFNNKDDSALKSSCSLRVNEPK